MTCWGGWLCVAIGLLTPATGVGQNVSAPIATARASVAANSDLTGQKIIGGTLANFADNSWQVALVLASDHDDPRVLFCGGTLLTRTLVLTAAHCVDGGTKESDVDIIAGSSDLMLDGVRLHAKKVSLHPAYHSLIENSNDVALIELKSGAPAQSHPIDLVDRADDGKLAEGMDVRATGWGAVQKGAGRTRDLRQVDIKIISNKHCNDPVSYGGKVDDTMLCAGSPQNRDTCQGDSGGPLTAMLNSSRVLVGVVSWGEGCGQPAKWGVYARLTAIPWVNAWVKSCAISGGHCISTKRGQK